MANRSANMNKGASIINGGIKKPIIVRYMMQSCFKGLKCCVPIAMTESITALRFAVMRQSTMPLSLGGSNCTHFMLAFGFSFQ
jgi:hypothetical protein